MPPLFQWVVLHAAAWIFRFGWVICISLAFAPVFVNELWSPGEFR